MWEIIWPQRAGTKLNIPEFHKMDPFSYRMPPPRALNINDVRPGFRKINAPAAKNLGFCAVCTEVTNQRCSACKVVFYCGLEHQQANWPQHKDACKFVKGQPAETKNQSRRGGACLVCHADTSLRYPVCQLAPYCGFVHYQADKTKHEPECTINVVAAGSVIAGQRGVVLDELQNILASEKKGLIERKGGWLSLSVDAHADALRTQFAEYEGVDAQIGQDFASRRELSVDLDKQIWAEMIITSPERPGKLYLYVYNKQVPVVAQITRHVDGYNGPGHTSEYVTIPRDDGKKIMALIKANGESFEAMEYRPSPVIEFNISEK